MSTIYEGQIRVRPMMTPSEVAARLSVSERTVYKLLERGELRSHRVGNRWRVSQEAFREYMAATVHVPSVEVAPHHPVADARVVTRSSHGPRW